MTREEANERELTEGAEGILIDQYGNEYRNEYGNIEYID